MVFCLWQMLHRKLVSGNRFKGSKMFLKALDNRMQGLPQQLPRSRTIFQLFSFSHRCIRQPMVSPNFLNLHSSTAIPPAEAPTEYNFLNSSLPWQPNMVLKSPKTCERRFGGTFQAAEGDQSQECCALFFYQ